MKNYLIVSLILSLAIGLGVAGCDTENPSIGAATGSLTLAFNNIAGSQELTLNKTTYQNAAGESFVVTKFNYFVSNFRLKKADGSEFVVPQDGNYFLVQEEKPTSQTLTLANVPAGNYTGMSFLIGVDSLRNLADISQRTGALDPALNDGMYWDWNSGYIFLKLEGTSASAPAAQNNTFFYHIGGFGGGYNGKKTINNLRTITVSFNGDVVQVSANAKPQLRLNADVLKVFNGSTKLSIAQNPSVMFDPYSTNIANNYAQMMSYDRILANQ